MSREPSESTQTARRKRLGQYFTGPALARLLVAVSDVQPDAAACDPMAGNGDMLDAVLEQLSSPRRLDGVEIDPAAHHEAVTRLDHRLPEGTSSTLLLGNAFDAQVVRQLDPDGYDLVITNPAYVRYQATTRGEVDADGVAWLPSAQEVRQGLLECLATLRAWPDQDKIALRVLAQEYSGLADLAVPAWMLAAGLVRDGGRLAIVVPESWLSRDYAAPIHYMLSRWFDVEFIIEDVNRSWFPDALVKTTLVVARRVSGRTTAFKHVARPGYVHVRVAATARDDRSPVGAAYIDESNPDDAFARECRRQLKRASGFCRPGITATWVAAAQASHKLETAASTTWLQKVEPKPAHSEKVHAVPHPVASLRDANFAVNFTTLEGLGWAAGQGLRTGANAFFYVTRRDDGWQPDQRLFDDIRLELPADIATPALRRQACLPAGLSITPEVLNEAVLTLQGWALPEDLEKSMADASSMADRIASATRTMPEGLAEHVRDASKASVGKGKRARLIPELSAVAPNSRQAHDRPDGKLPSFWYVLPPFTDRHQPALVVPRVQGGEGRTYLNVKREALVDANFSTLWPTKNSAVPSSAMLALMNSLWVAALLEVTAAVMGGGALKVEASHLRRLALPELDDSTWAELGAVGDSLATAPPKDLPACLSQVDTVLARTLCNGADGGLTNSLHELVTRRREERAR